MSGVAWMEVAQFLLAVAVVSSIIGGLVAVVRHWAKPDREVGDSYPQEEPAFVGWDHVLYDEWKYAVDNDETLLGFAEWVKRYPENDDV